MLTVLIKYRATGREVLYPAACVEFIPSDKIGIPSGLLIVANADCELSQHIGGSTTEDDLRDVFVMNENGSTVARYLL